MGNQKKTVESEAGGAAASPPAAPESVETRRKRRNNVAVMVLLGFDVLVGAGISYVGFSLLESQTITLAGAILATIGLALMLAYQLVGREK